MKGFLMSIVLVVAIIFGAVFVGIILGDEGTRVIKIPDAGVVLTVPEKTPDFHLFPGQVLGSQQFQNGNAVLVIESMNGSRTVDVVVLVVKIEGKLHFIAMQVTYCPAGFDKIDMNKPIEDQIRVEYLGDMKFMKTGVPSDEMTRVKKLPEYGEISKFIEGVKI